MKKIDVRHIRRRLTGLSERERNTVVGGTTVAELVGMLEGGIPDVPGDAFYQLPDERQVFLLGRLSVILDVLARQQRRIVLVRWFE